jgi:hypothetical protein
MEEKSYMGYIETRSRILDELLEKTAFKDNLRLFLKNIDPNSCAQLVRTLLGKDIEVPLALTGALPVFANCFIKAGYELITQLREMFPPPLLASFVDSLLDEIDKDTLARLIAESRALGNDLAPVFLAAWKVIEHKTAQAGEKL